MHIACQVTLVDTAGLRESSDDIELQGMQRARAEVASADIIVLVQDASAAEPATGTAQGASTTAGSGSFGDSLGLPGLLLGSTSNGAPASSHGQRKKLLLVRNKADLLRSASSAERQDEGDAPACSISCRTGEGMDALLESLSALVADVAGSGEGQHGSTLITRHARLRIIACCCYCALPHGWQSPSVAQPCCRCCSS